MTNQIMSCLEELWEATDLLLVLSGAGWWAHGGLSSIFKLTLWPEQRRTLLLRPCSLRALLTLSTPWSFRVCTGAAWQHLTVWTRICLFMLNNPAYALSIVVSSHWFYFVYSGNMFSELSVEPFGQIVCWRWLFDYFSLNVESVKCKMMIAQERMFQTSCLSAPPLKWRTRTLSLRTVYDWNLSYKWPDIGNF